MRTGKSEAALSPKKRSPGFVFLAMPRFLTSIILPCKKKRIPRFGMSSCAPGSGLENVERGSYVILRGVRSFLLARRSSWPRVGSLLEQGALLEEVLWLRFPLWPRFILGSRLNCPYRSWRTRFLGWRRVHFCPASAWLLVDADLAKKSLVSGLPADPPGNPLRRTCASVFQAFMRPSSSQPPCGNARGRAEASPQDIRFWSACQGAMNRKVRFWRTFLGFSPTFPLPCHRRGGPHLPRQASVRLPR